MDTLIAGHAKSIDLILVTNIWTNQFKKDYKLAMKRHLDIDLLDDIIHKLASSEQLPEKNILNFWGQLQKYLILFKEGENMKKYVFNEYRDKMGIGSKKIFDSELEAVQAAKDHWGNMTESDQRSYLDDPAGMFLVFEIEATQEQLEKIEAGDVLVDGFWMADIWDALN